MFTGLVRDVGKIVSWHRAANSVRFSIETKLPIEELAIGASVACNGVCLTVTSVKIVSNELRVFEVEAGPQTLALTRFGLPQFKGLGEFINLEPALRVGDSMGGHYVSGHIDGLAKVSAIEPTSDGFWRLRIALNPEHLSYVVKKGSIAVGGVSLTVADCSRDEQWLEIMLIPHTIAQTNLQFLNTPDLVEIEFDSQAKMVAELLTVMLPIHLKTLTQKN